MTVLAIFALHRWVGPASHHRIPSWSLRLVGVCFG
jgi:hypothetical protein